MHCIIPDPLTSVCAEAMSGPVRETCRGSVLSAVALRGQGPRCLGSHASSAFQIHFQTHNKVLNVCDCCMQRLLMVVLVRDEREDEQSGMQGFRIKGRAI